MPRPLCCYTFSRQLPHRAVELSVYKTPCSPGRVYGGPLDISSNTHLDHQNSPPAPIYQPTWYVAMRSRPGHMPKFHTDALVLKYTSISHIALLIAAATGAVSTAFAVPNQDVIEKRDSTPFVMSNYRDSRCGNSVELGSRFPILVSPPVHSNARVQSRSTRESAITSPRLLPLPPRCKTPSFWRARSWRRSVLTSPANSFSPSDQKCVIKFWSNSGCTGTASTWYFHTLNRNQCFPSASQNGIPKLLNGAKSLIANCAFDEVPN